MENFLKDLRKEEDTNLCNNKVEEREQLHMTDYFTHRLPGLTGVSTRVPVDVIVADATLATDIAVGRKKKRWEDERKGVGTTPNDT